MQVPSRSAFGAQPSASRDRFTVRVDSARTQNGVPRGSVRKRGSEQQQRRQPEIVHPVVSSSGSSSSVEADQPAAEAAPALLRDHNGVGANSALQPGSGSSGRLVGPAAPIVLIAKPLPRVLLLHCGGTLGMDPGESYTEDLEGHVVLREGTGGRYHEPTAPALKPPVMLSNLLTVVPELRTFAQLEVKVVMNKDSSNMGPRDWLALAKTLHASRDAYDAFLIVHGTDTMAYSASALSLMLVGFRKPIVMTGSQLPLAMPRSDARQNLIDAITCATAGFAPPHIALCEVAVCFGGKLMRGNRVQKVSTSDYQAFASPSMPPLAQMGIDVSWNAEALLKPYGAYTPRFKLDPRVVRIPIVPGSDPRVAYGDLAERGVRGVVLEAFGTANMPNEASSGWLPWLRSQRRKGLAIHLSSQCSVGPLRPELYRSGSAALAMGVSSGPQMTPECSVTKLMLTLSYPDIPMGIPLAGEI